MLARGVWRDDGFAAALGQPVSKLAGIVGPVGDQAPRGGDALEQSCRAEQVMSVAGGDGEGDGPAGVVGYGVNLGRPSAA